MPRLFTAIVLPLLLAPSLGVAQRADIRAQSSNPAFVIHTTSVTRLSSGEGTRGHFWAGAGIGLLGGALIGGAIGSTTEFCIDSCSAAQARSGAIIVGVILGGSASGRPRVYSGCQVLVDLARGVLLETGEDDTMERRGDRVGLRRDGGSGA